MVHSRVRFALGILCLASFLCLVVIALLTLKG